jgi:hypothetical protein
MDSFKQIHHPLQQKQKNPQKKKTKKKLFLPTLQIATNGLDDEDRGETVHLKIVKTETKK